MMRAGPVRNHGAEILLGWLALICPALLAWPNRSIAQPVQRAAGSVFPRTSSAAENLLRSADLHLREKQWTAAVELLLRAVDQYGDIMTPVPPRPVVPDQPSQAQTGTPLFINLKNYCQRVLSQLPPEGLRAYRSRVDGEAEDRFRRGQQNRDEVALHWVIENAFCSSWGDDAANLLGDLAFQKGQIDEARAFYRLLAPGVGAPSALIYPDPSVDVDLVRAKIVLCNKALAEGEQAPPDLAAPLPDREATFAGRTGPLAEILGQSLREDAWRREGSNFEGNIWSTFAGNPQRAKVATVPLDVGALQWTYPLKREMPMDLGSNSPFERGGILRGSENQTQYPYVHPIVLGDEVLIGDDRGILSFKLEQDAGDSVTQGEPTWRGEDPALAAFPGSIDSLSSRSITLTAHGDRVYYRLGLARPDSRFRDNPRPPRSFIMAVERSSQGKLLWKVDAEQIVEDRPGAGQPLGATFGGTPIADDQGVYVSLVKTGPQSMSWLACLDPETGSTKWIRFLCGASPVALEEQDPFRRNNFAIDRDTGQQLLSLYGSNLYYQTDLGALACVDARTGTLNWLATYPRDDAAVRERAGRQTLRPAVISDGRVLVAPSDSRSVMAFDAGNGRLLWKSEPTGRIDHLLGVSSGRLVASGDSVWTIDCATGAILTQWPDQRSSETGFGRGIISGSEIYWPTRDRIYVLDLASGRPGRRPPIELRESFRGEGGNLVAGEGYLVIAQADRLAVYCQNSRLLQRYRDLIAQNPNDALLHYRLALIAEATGETRLALDALADASRLASGSDRADGEALSSAAPARMRRILIRMGKEAAQRRAWGEAAELFDAAAERAAGAEDQIISRFLQVDALVAAGQAEKAVDLLHNLLASANPLRAIIPVDPHRRVRADLLVTSRLAEIRQQFGTEPFQKSDALAQELLQRGLREKNRRVLSNLVVSYPVATVIDEARFALASQIESDGDMLEAIPLYKQILTGTADRVTKARAWLGLANSYEQLNENALARHAFRQAEMLAADSSVLLHGQRLPVREHVLQQVQRLDLKTADSNGKTPAASPPWSLVTTRAKDHADAWIPLESGEGGLISAGDMLAAIHSDRLPDFSWRKDLGADPIWASQVGDLYLVGSTSRLSALRKRSGELAWSFPGTKSAGNTPPDPFQPTSRQVADPLANETESLSHFHLRGDRLYFHRGESTLVAVDAFTGQTEWIFRLDSGRLSPFALHGPSRVLLQATKPNRRLVLDAYTGELLHEIKDGPDVEPWSSEPVALGDTRAVMAVNPRTVLALDLLTGSILWESHDTSALPRFTPPRLFGDEDGLLVLSPNTLTRLDPLTGRAIWSLNATQVVLPSRPDQLLLDEQRILLLSDSDSDVVVQSIHVESGQPSWKQTIRKAGWTNWRLQSLGNRILVCPLGPPQAGESRPTRVPLVALRIADGRILQRLLVPSSGSIESLQSSGSGFLIATQDGFFRYASRTTEGDSPIEDP